MTSGGRYRSQEGALQRRPDDEQPSSRGRPPTTPTASVETLVASWLSAFAAAESAIRVNSDHLGPADAGPRIHRLRAEREQIAVSLAVLVHGHKAADFRSSTTAKHCLRVDSVMTRSVVCRGNQYEATAAYTPPDSEGGQAFAGSWSDSVAIS